MYVLYLSGGLEIGPSLLVSLKAMLSTPNRKKDNFLKRGVYM